MSINIGPPAIEELRPRIVVIGVGGAGGNAIANMIQAQIEGVDFVVANTDAQALNNAVAESRIQLGPDITQGLGAGSRPEVGRAAAEETIAEIDRVLDGVHMCFIAAGMGGGTGTGAAPIIAKAAREKGVLTVGVVTKPFLFEGTRRMRAAESGIEELQKHVDTLIVIPNQNLFLVAKAETTFKEAFSLADEVLQQGVRSITDLMVMPGLINLDFADVRSVMGEMGKAMMGTGEGEGPNRALEAAERAIANPLLDGVSMQGAKGVIISIIGGDDMKLLEVDEAANHIRELVDQDANIIWGSAFNPDLQGKIRVSVVATGIEQTAQQAEEASRPLNLGMSRGPVRPAVPAQGEAQPLFERGPRGTAPAPQAPAAPAFAPPPAPEAAPLELDAFAGEEAAGQEPDDMPGELELGASEEIEDADAGKPASAYASLTGVRPTRGEPLDLGFDQLESQPEEAPAQRQDDLLADADRLAGQDEPITPLSVKRRAAAAEEPAAPAAPGRAAAASGSTLFERMANLSRSSKAAGEDSGESDDDGGSISIPRFLGRQNNQ
ncbi:cell division protein FtsZ [Novosphingobium album (ex Liu et al. 2023)]|uniref:Cell division protein FtsZ n=1 Tax=Novosphingobium album (ex Liu et al. 2023) TaxID=3031130 RepID=A0ABT5WK30_9SPHN|nr:cell division protein FtsZ [Novosphingobium album (ex Liu et al. 2023)]MDE8650403.1 cell division protein FtsZ [Novosphingobium album (ex Liu et al. 2023)]